MRCGSDFDGDLRNFPCLPALKSVFQADSIHIEPVELTSGLSGKLMDLVLDVGLKLSEYRQYRSNLPLAPSGKLVDLGEGNLLDKCPKWCSGHGSTRLYSCCHPSWTPLPRPSTQHSQPLAE